MGWAACAQALVGEGAEVTICGSDTGRAEAAAERLGAGTRWVVADLTVPHQAERFVADAAAALQVDGGAYQALL